VARTWLVGQSTGRRALLLDFAAGTQPLERSIVAGAAFDGELGFYPGRQPLRALVKSRSDAGAIGSDFLQPADTTVEAGLRRYAEALSLNPWTYRWPLLLAGVRTVLHDDRWFLVDSQNHGLPVRAGFARSLQLWRLVSASGGTPITVVVEWDGVTALPISAFREPVREYVDLAPRWAA
jgi:hypothetical protein